MSQEILDIFFQHNQSEPPKKEKYKRAAFTYPGNKYKYLQYILPRLPIREVWCEAFGGSGVVTLNREPSKLEIFNDRYAGLVAFFKCIREEQLCLSLVKRLDFTPYSREEFETSEWVDVNDPVERAARWYVSIQQSFGGLGLQWGRALEGQLFNTFWNGIERIPEIANRFKYVQVENLDWRKCLTDYDSEDTVFYLDPPYFATEDQCYNDRMSRQDHIELVERIWDCKGFVALSGYKTSLYDKYPWTDVISYPVQITHNRRAGHSTTEGIEYLWMKDQ